MKESVAIAKDADRKKDISPTRSDNSIHRVPREPERQLGSLRDVIGNIRRDGNTPSAESIATHMCRMHTAQRAPVLLALQQTHGNRYVQRVLTGIQAKLEIGPPGDIYEQEADRMADEVMRMPDPQVQQQPEEEEKKKKEELIRAKHLSEQITPLVQRQIEEEEEKEETLQAKELPSQTPDGTPNLEARINAMRGGGQPLPDSVRAFFEPRFGRDFSQVRIHTDGRAYELANFLNARGFTHKDDIWFGKNETPTDKRLLAHELTHVVQQRLSNVNRDSPTTISPRDKSDIEADKIAGEVDNGEKRSVHVTQSVRLGIKRWRRLGSWSWDHPIHGAAQRQGVVIWVGSTREWTAALRHMDTEQAFRERLEGFLLAALNEVPQGAPQGAWGAYITAEGGEPRRRPSEIRRPTTGPLNYRALVTRPTDSQIRDLLRALYTPGGGLDLPNLWFIERTAGTEQYFMPLLQRFVGRYQNLIIAEMSELARGGTMEAERIEAVAEQGGAGMRAQMVTNAAATALVAIDTRAAARDDTSIEYAKNLCRNSGRIIRHLAIEAREAMEFIPSVADDLFDVVWAAVPGGLTVRIRVLNAAAKVILKRATRAVLDAISEDENIEARRNRIEEQYQHYLSRLVNEGHITSEMSSDCFDSFVITLR